MTSELVKPMDFNDVIGQDSLTRFEEHGSKTEKKEKRNARNCKFFTVILKFARFLNRTSMKFLNVIIFVILPWGRVVRSRHGVRPFRKDRRGEVVVG